MEGAKRRGIFTVGIGYGENEIANALINKEANDVLGQAYGVTCQCGCAGGEATATAPDVLISAAASNWGAYLGATRGDAHSGSDSEPTVDATAWIPAMWFRPANS